jgi:hypothetical protein
VEFVLDLLQGAGIAAGIGIRPFLPVLLTGALASANVGLDFDGTDFALRRRADLQTGPLVWLLLALAMALGALVAAGSLADHGHPVAAGVVAGAAAAALGYFAARSLFGRVRRRLDPDAQAALPVYGEGAALGAAGVSILFPPLAIFVIAGLGWLLAGGRRRAGEKYAGLRILR